MKTKNLFFVITFILLLVGLLVLQPLFSAPVNAQVFIYTPTAEENGNIYYVVKSGDTCESIALLNNISLDSLRSLNQLNLDDCNNLTIGRKLLLGTVPTAVITPGPSPTPTSLLPTPMPVVGKGTICVYLFNDTNGNAMVDTGETALAGGEVGITSKSGNYAKTASTTGDGNPVCFEDIDEGEYTISMAIPEGYNATTDQNYTDQLKAGDTSTVNFGAQQGSLIDIGGTGSGGSILLAVVGGLILIVGVGIGFYAYVIMKRK
jgi:LysM repeat protein